MFQVNKFNKGILNEKAFANVLDKRKYKDVPKKLQDLIDAIYEFKVDNEDYIECWQSEYKEKADIKLKINGVIKGISIKMGTGNSVHLENISSFSMFLTKIGLSQISIDIFNEFINGTIDGIKVNNEVFKRIKSKELLKINKELNDLFVKTNIIIRALFQGKESQKYGADAIIHGTPDYFIWATKSEILKYLMFSNTRKNSAISVSSLNIQSWNKRINCNSDFNPTENFVQIKWHMLKKDLYYITMRREKNKLLL